MNQTALIVGALFAATTARAQCEPAWLPSPLAPELDSYVLDMTMWDPDGPGPRSPLLAVGGNFAHAGGVSAQCVAAYDPATNTWSALGSGLQAIRTLFPMPNGALISGNGYITGSGPYDCRVARWDGGAWTTLGSTMNGPVTAIAVLSNGDLIAAGSFTDAGVPAKCIARWNGAAWTAFGPNAAFTSDGGIPSIEAMVVLPSGDLIVAGNFTAVGGMTALRVARWDGLAWSDMNGGMNAHVGCLAVLPDGSPIAGGYFTTAGNEIAHRIAYWNGSDWTPLDSGMTGSVVAITVLPNGEIVAAGDFQSAGGHSANRIARWDGTQWSALGSGVSGEVSSFAIQSSGTLVVGGSFATAGGLSTPRIARWGCPPCYANCDASTAPPILNANDFQCFLNKFAAGDSLANCDGSTAPPTMNANDFQCFLNLFAAGCA